MYTEDEIADAVMARARVDAEYAEQLEQALQARSKSWLERLIGTVLYEWGIQIARSLLERAVSVLFGF